MGIELSDKVKKLTSKELRYAGVIQLLYLFRHLAMFDWCAVQ